MCINLNHTDFGRFQLIFKKVTFLQRLWQYIIMIHTFITVGTSVVNSSKPFTIYVSSSPFDATSSSSFGSILMVTPIAITLKCNKLAFPVLVCKYI